MNINKKNYASKHHKNQLCPKITKKIKDTILNNSISCKIGHKISKELMISAKTIGINIDLLEIKINKCQLGLFGYNFEKKNSNGKTVTLELKTHILKNVNNGKLTCEKAWCISKKLSIEKKAVSIACEFLGIRISSCQLGAF